jgi:hypothetical protein
MVPAAFARKFDGQNMINDKQFEKARPKNRRALF